MNLVCSSIMTFGLGVMIIHWTLIRIQVRHKQSRDVSVLQTVPAWCSRRQMHKYTDVKAENHRHETCLTVFFPFMVFWSLYILKQWRNVFTGKPVRGEGWDVHDNTQDDYIFLPLSTQCYSSHLNFSINLKSARGCNLALLHVGASPPTKTLFECALISIQSARCV